MRLTLTEGVYGLASLAQYVERREYEGTFRFPLPLPLLHINHWESLDSVCKL